ncbi:MAG: hypothetical protein JWM32_2211 [Verrucomicrobia bacterium]|nr:hypothetical protein [Verrucomicrobiota bacterium]
MGFDLSEQAGRLRYFSVAVLARTVLDSVFPLMPNPRTESFPEMDSGSAAKWIGAGLLLLLVGLLYWPALDGDFLTWDDNTSIYENAYLGGLNGSRIEWAFTDTTQSLRYMPLSWLAYSAIFELGGLNPWYYHAANVAVHLANAVLLYFALRRILRFVRPDAEARWSEIGAWFAAAIWAAHPLRVEVVAWALPLTYALTWCALLVTLHFCLAALSSGRRIWKIATVVAYTIALLIYPIGISAWLAFAVLAAWLARKSTPDAPARQWKWIFVLAVPAIASAGLAVWIRWHGAGHWNPPLTLAQFGVAQRAAQAAYAWAYYVGSPFRVIGASPIYGSLLEVNPMGARFVFAGVVVVAGSAVAWTIRRRSGGFGAWWLATLALALPALGLTEHPFFTSDRYTGLIGIVFAIGMIGAWAGVASARIQRVIALVACAALVGCALLAERQIGFWRSTETLFRHVAETAQHPTVLAEAHFRLGTVAEDAGSYDVAKKEAVTGLALDPSHRNLKMLLERVSLPPPPIRRAANTQLELARFALQLGDTWTAQAHFRRAVALDPGAIEPRVRLALLLVGTGEPREALAHFSWAERRKHDGTNALFYTSLEESARRRGDTALAEAARRARERESSVVGRPAPGSVPVHRI